MSQVKDYCRRLKLPGAVTEKAEEYHRLAEVRCSSALRSEPCLTLVCIDLACVKLGEPVDKKQIQRLSGVQSRGYLSSYQLVEKLLNVTGQVGVKELAVRFGSFQAEGLAEELLKRYKDYVEGKYTSAQKEALDLTKPLYPAAALYCACRLLKIRCDKSKYQEASLSSKSVFQNVLDEINQFAPKDIDSFIQRKTRSTAVTQSKDGTECRSSDSVAVKESHSKATSRESFHCRVQSNPTSPAYLEWKENILKEAKRQLDSKCLQ